MPKPQPKRELAITKSLSTLTSTMLIIHVITPDARGWLETYASEFGELKSAPHGAYTLKVHHQLWDPNQVAAYIECLGEEIQEN